MTINEEVDHVIETEINRAIAKHGAQEGHPDYMWALICGEEMGEIQQAILQTGVKQDSVQCNGRVFDEVVQLAAVTTYWARLMLKRQLAEAAHAAMPPLKVYSPLSPEQIKAARKIVDMMPSVSHLEVQPIYDPLDGRRQ